MRTIPTFGEPARRLVAQVKAKRHQLVGSLSVLGELLVIPTKRKNEFGIAAYRRLFSSRQVLLLPYGPEAMEVYVELRALQGVRPVDALHLATAAHASVGLFVTEDTGLLPKSVQGIGQIANIASSQAVLA